MVPASQLYTCIRSTKHTEGLLGKAGQIRLVTGRFRTSFIFENLHVPHLVELTGGHIVAVRLALNLDDIKTCICIYDRMQLQNYT